MAVRRSSTISKTWPATAAGTTAATVSKDGRAGKPGPDHHGALLADADLRGRGAFPHDFDRGAATRLKSARLPGFRFFEFQVLEAQKSAPYLVGDRKAARLSARKLARRWM